MCWWFESKENKSRRRFNEASQRALEKGDLPPVAIHRLKLQQRDNPNFFSSNLSSNEHLLTREVGYEPIGLVMGTSFFKVNFWSFFNSYYYTSGELSAISYAQINARSLALKRLQKEAALLGAQGVIGVQLKFRTNSSGITEFTAIGTAIRIPDRAIEEIPFTSNLSGQDFWKLYQAGYYPRGLVLGACSYYIHTDWNTRSLTVGGFFGRGSNQNQEITQYTQGFQDARDISISRLENNIGELQAQGAVGMLIDTKIEEIEYEINETKYRDLLIHFISIGTAIITDKEIPKPKQEKTLLLLNLASKKSSII